MRKEVHTVYNRSAGRLRRKSPTARHTGFHSSIIRVIALVCILGSSAYLLFTWNSTDPQIVQARQDVSQPFTTPENSNPQAESTTSDSTNLDSEPAVTIAAPNATDDNSFPWLAAVLKKATPAQAQTAQKLLAFASSGDLTDVNGLTRADVQSLADLLVGEFGKENLAELIESQLGLPASEFLAFPNPSTELADLFETITTTPDSEGNRPLIFTDNVQSDGTVTGNVHVIPTGTKRVYAAFENQGALQNLDRVLAVWRDPSNEKMVFTEFEPVRAGSTYNYVWLELKDGWPKGYYQLDLYHPQRNKELLASRSFNVR